MIGVRKKRNGRKTIQDLERLLREMDMLNHRLGKAVVRLKANAKKDGVWREKTSRLALMLMMSNIGLASLSVFYGAGALDRAVFGSQFQIGEFTASDPGRVAFWVVMAGLSAIQFGMAQGWFSRQ